MKATWCIFLSIAFTAIDKTYGQAPQKVEASGPFHMHLLKIGDTYQGLKFNRATGETWQIVGEKWEKVTETAARLAGDYELTMIPTENGFMAFRLERTTGATSLLGAKKWNAIKEPANPGPAAAHGGKGYQLRYVRVGGQLHVVRFHAGTGAAAHIQGNGYQDLAEAAGAVPPGDYDVTMMATAERWMAFRFNRSSGATWLLRANQWVRVAEPE